MSSVVLVLHCLRLIVHFHCQAFSYQEPLVRSEQPLLFEVFSSILERLWCFHLINLFFHPSLRKKLVLCSQCPIGSRVRLFITH